ncbi:MAG: hypothetical protein M3077_11650 [Candidatus Dormibacteraeota bacterium]|nr:hypothetical protein [Candidatus Dormibacteraeota bacterium]
MTPPRRDFWRFASVIRLQIPTRALLLAVSILAVLLAAALVFEPGPAAIRTLPPPTQAGPAEPVGNGQFRFVPKSARITSGVRYRLTIFTHCGLDYPIAVDFDGSFWDPSGPNLSGGNPPPGYRNPFDEGIMTLISPTRARYQSQGGVVTSFTRHSGPRVAGLCS